ncbi:Apoptosi inhibitor 5 [Taenia crassiceps]|uniref:Apoptosi inhibitor 5 n=1 Tax=Taenia crassiceps TaxID=6207 RepID=A0ABR4QTF9_9CEST
MISVSLDSLYSCFDTISNENSSDVEVASVDQTRKDSRPNSLVDSSIMFTLLEMDPSGTLAGIFNHLSTESEIHRENLVKFLMENLQRLPDGKISSELEGLIIQQLNKLLPLVSRAGFVQLISLIASLKSTTSLQARQILVDKITDHVVQSVPVFNPQVVSSVVHIRDCGKQVVQLLSNVSAGAFLKYLLVKVIPKISLVKSPSDQRSILRLLAEFSSHPGVTLTSVQSDKKTHILLPLYNFLMEVLPEAPLMQEPMATLGSVGSDKLLVPAFAVECCIYSLLSLLRFYPKFLCTADIGDDEAAREGSLRLQALRQKVQFTARLIYSYKASIIAQVQAALQVEGMPSVTAEEARRALENIEKMVRCVFRPRIESEYLTDIALSWVNTTQALKRPAPSSPLTGIHSPTKQSYPQLQRRLPLKGGRFGGSLTGRGRARGGGRRRF